MNIGICTVHYVHNYGAMLQGYALKKVLEQMGHNVVMTDRRSNPLTQWSPRPFFKSSLKEMLLYPKYLYKWYLPVYVTKRGRENNFEKFLHTYLNDQPYNGEKLDAIIYGSDQIWSKFEYGFDDIFWGIKDSNTDKRISYAASMGSLAISDNDEAYIKDALSRFSGVSVREKNLQEFLNVHHLFYKQVELIIDPTFLLLKEEWEKINPRRIVKEPYLLFYDFQKDEGTTRIAHYLAEKKHLRIIRLSDGVEHVNKEEGYMVTAGPIEFISLFRNADFVVSSSFHGTAFSVIFNKPFYVRQIWNTDRVKTLLDIMGLTDRFIDKIDDVDINKSIEYNLVNQKIEQHRQNGLSFLKGKLYM